MTVYCCFQSVSDGCTYSCDYLEKIFLEEVAAELWVLEKEEAELYKTISYWYEPREIE
jgi:hypothetical protein